MDGIKNEPLPIRQWGIVSVTVMPQRGIPKTLNVEVAERGKNHVRLKIELPEVEALTLVYGDSDDGHTQERLIATSKSSSGERKLWAVQG